MPSRAKRKPAAKTTRAKPKIPDGDEGKNLTDQQRKKKLRLFLADFDQEVQTRLKKIQKHGKILCESLQNLENLELAQLPPAVRDMDVEDYLSAGGTLKDALLWLADNAKDRTDKTDCFKMPDLTVTVKRKRTIKQLVPKLLDSVAEDETVKTSTKRTMRGKTVEFKAPPTTRKSLRSTRQSSSRFRTPAGQHFASKYMDTPFVTPKFDPRLFTTPGMARLQRRQEKVYRPCVSETGSPIKSNEMCIVFDQYNGSCSYVDVSGETVKINPHDEGVTDKLVALQDFISKLIRK